MMMQILHILIQTGKIVVDIMMQLDDDVDSTHTDVDRQIVVDIMMQLDDVVDSTHTDIDRQTVVDIMM